MLSRRRLSPTDRLIFLHVPKTGGTTLTHILLRHFPEDAVCPARHWYTSASWKVQKHRIPLSEVEQDLSQYSFFTGHFLYDMVNFFETKPIIITLFRDPVSRVVSVYNYIRSLEDHPLQTEVNKMSLEEFAEWDVPDRPFENKNRYIHDIGAKLNISQPSDIPSAQPELGNAYELAHSRINEFDFVGISERFNESVLLLSYTLGIPPILTFNNYRVTPKSDNYKTPSSRALQIIEQNNAEDIALYEFSKRKFDVQWNHFVQSVFLKE